MFHNFTPFDFAMQRHGLSKHSLPVRFYRYPVARVTGIVVRYRSHCCGITAAEARPILGRGNVGLIKVSPVSTGFMQISIDFSTGKRGFHLGQVDRKCSQGRDE